MDEIEQLEQAIAALEAQRDLLGNDVVETAQASIREKLASLRPQAAEVRKVVTVLFADLVGFTGMAEKMDPEDVRDLLSNYFDRWTACINQFGGMVEKFIGDAVMAVFGLPMSHEEDPESAIRAALCMRQTLDELNKELIHTHAIQLAVRVGIHTGPVVASLLDKRSGQDFVAVGDTVNLASRLQSAAPANGILISHATYRHVRGIFSVKALEPIQVKGKKEMVQVYLLQWAKQRGFHIQTRGIEGIETHIVGRSDELTRLESAFTTVKTTHEPVMITIAGDAGIGKSRLLAEFDHWLELLPDIVLYFKGRTRASMQNQAFSLLRDLFAFRFQIHDSDSNQEMQEKFENGFRQAYNTAEPPDLPSLNGPAGSEIQPAEPFSPEETRRRAHFTGHLLGFDFSTSPYSKEIQEQGRSFRELALDYLSDYFCTLSRRWTVLLLLEDIHWADESSLDAIIHLALAAARNKAAILILCAARPAFFEGRSDWGQGIPFYSRLDLQPLNRQQSRTLVTEILQKVQDLPSELEDLIVSNAEGNPFYIEELIKMFIEEGAIVKNDEDHWQVEIQHLQRVSVPPTLTGVLQARLDSLPADNQVLLQRASVIGRIFWDEAVAQMGEVQNPLQVRQALDGLDSREMVYRREGSRFDNTREYQFKHALLRDVAYENILKRERRIYHSHAARWLEQMTLNSGRADEVAALIGDHFEQAGEYELASHWYLRAGLRAAAHYANTEALRCLTRAAEVTPEADRSARFEILSAREKTYNLIANREAQLQDLQALGRLAEELGEDRKKAQVFLRWSGYYEKQSALDQAQAAAHKAIQHAQAADDKELETQAFLFLGGSFWRSARYREARQPLERALAQARSLQNQTLLGDVVRNMAIVLDALGEYELSRRYFEEALELARQVGNRLAIGQALNSLGIIAMNQMDYSRALQNLEEALALKREIGDRLGEVLNLVNLGILNLILAEPIKARAYYERILDLSQEIQTSDGERAALLGLAGVALYLGENDKGRTYLETLHKMMADEGDVQVKSEVLRYLCMLHRRLGGYTIAIAYGNEAVAFAEESGVWQDIFTSYTCLGHALHAAGKLDEAEAAYETALAWPSAPDKSPLFLETWAGLAWLYLDHGDPQRALIEVEKILAVLQDSRPLSEGLVGLVEPFQVVLVCYQVLQAGHDSRAQKFLKNAQAALFEKAGEIESGAGEAVRRSFLEHVPANRQLSALKP